MQLISSSTILTAAADVAANTQTTIDSVWVLVLIALSIPLGFYIVHRVMGLFPGRRGR